MLTSLKILVAKNSYVLVGPIGGQGDVEWQLPVENLGVLCLCGPTGRELTKLLPHLPRLSKLEIVDCGKITQLIVGVDLQKTTLAASKVEEVEAANAAVELTVEHQRWRKLKQQKLLLFPAHLSESLRELRISDCPELVLVDPPNLLPETGRGRGLQALRCLERLGIWNCPKLLSACSFSSRLFPSSLQYLDLDGVELPQVATLDPLSNLTSLTPLAMFNCGEDLRCECLLPLLTTGGQLSKLSVIGSPRFFAGWDPNRRRVLQVEGGAEQQLQLLSPLSSSTLRELWTDEAAGLLAAPICSLLSSSLTRLYLCGMKEMECFTKEQEDALQLLTSLQELEFCNCDKLQHLPAELHKLMKLWRLEVWSCPAVRSLPKDGLPKSLILLIVWNCGNEELKQQCRGFVGTIPEITLD